MATRGQGRRRKDENELRGKNDARKELVSKSKYSERVVVSLQTCSVKANREKLEKLLPTELQQGDARDAYVNKRNRINGLLSVWDMLMADAIGKDGEEYTKCFIPFDDALEIFYDSFEEVSVKPLFVNTDKDKFLYALIHEQWGLCVYVVTHEDCNQRFIVVRPDKVDMRLFLDEISEKSEDEVRPRMHLDKPFVQNLLSTMDSEWDKVVARVLLGIDRSRKELENIGIDAREISRNMEKVCKIYLSTCKISCACSYGYFCIEIGMCQGTQQLVYS